MIGGVEYVEEEIDVVRIRLSKNPKSWKGLD